jgi:3-oxoacyl-(acyl-carrier-protein) synthase
MDVIAACEVFQHQKAFRLGTTAEIDPTFRSRYLAKGENLPDPVPKTILISSLGFGGVHAVALLRNVLANDRGGKLL